MEFLSVAVDACHPFLRPVEVTGNPLIFTQVFVADACAMAGHAVILHGRGLSELMLGNKSPTQFIRSADVALTTCGVTLLAVVFKSRSQWRAFREVASSGFKSCFHSTYRGVKAILVHAGNVFVAGITTNLRRVGYQTYMGCFLFFSTTVSTVTDNAANLTMRALDKLGITQEDLLPHLQRR